MLPLFGASYPECASVKGVCVLVTLLYEKYQDIGDGKCHPLCLGADNRS